MARFTYMVRDGSGAAMTGELVARSSAEAVHQLRSEGKYVVRLNETDEQQPAAPAVRRRFGRVRQDEVIYFANQLAGMVDSGVPLADALEATIDRAPAGAFRSVVEDIIQRVQGGIDLSAALAAHPKTFPPMFVHIVRASEATGTLGAMLRRIAEYLVNQRDIRKRVVGALVYPAFMVVFAAGAMAFLLTFVLPKFTSIYAGKKATLPLPTRLLMHSSDWLVAHWVGVVLGLAAGIALLALFLRTDAGRELSDRLRLKAPVLGGMFRKACLARALRTLGAMISAGVSVLDAVLITRDVVGNRVFGRVFEAAHGKLQGGEQLSQALVDAPYIPRPVWQMLHAGERTGQLGPAMERIAELSEADLRHTIRSVTQFIEPVMIVIVGTMVGAIAIAMLLPIFQISRVMAQ